MKMGAIIGVCYVLEAIDKERKDRETRISRSKGDNVE
jgi:hypothetical protein